MYRSTYLSPRHYLDLLQAPATLPRGNGNQYPLGRMWVCPRAESMTKKIRFIRIQHYRTEHDIHKKCELIRTSQNIHVYKWSSDMKPSGSVRRKECLVKAVHLIGEGRNARLRHPPQWRTALLSVNIQSLKIISRNN
jgi:hypothetical protein